MTFRELFDRYRDGTATDEERRIVEEELDKAALINEHLFGSWEEPAPAEAPAGELKQVKKSLRRRNLLLVLTSLVLTAAIALGVVQYGIPMAESSYFDPTRATWSEEKTDLELALECYYTLFAWRQMFVGVEPAQDTGFASWAVELCYVDGDEDGRTIYRTAAVDKNEIRFPRDTLRFIAPELFERNMLGFSREELPEYMTEYVSARLSRASEEASILAAITFAEDMTAEELMKLQRQFRGLFYWAGVRTKKGLPRTEPLIGVHLSQGREDCGVNAAYPDLECGFPTEYNVESHFRSLVTYCRDYQKNTMDIGIVEDPEYFDKVLSYLDENGLTFYGCFASGDAEAFLWLAENGYISGFAPVEIDTHFTYNYQSDTFGG